MAEQPASPEAVSDPARDRLQVLRWIAAALAAWPLLGLGSWLFMRLVDGLPAWAVQGEWPLPVALALGAAVSWRRLRTTVPGLIGWLLGTILLALVRIADPGCAGLLALLILQGPLTITLVMAECARSRRCQQGDPPMGGARAVMWGLAGGFLLFTLSSLRWTNMERYLRDESSVLVLSGIAAPTFVVLMLLWWLSKQLVGALLPRTGRLSADGHTVLNSLLGYGTFVACCLSLPLLLPLAALCGLLSRSARLRLLAAAMRRGMSLVLFSAPTVAWRYDGELAALEHARVVVANHEGMLDILAVCALPGTRTLLAKTWVFRAFPLGLAARAAGLRNSDALEAEDYTADAAATSAADVAAGILVFPEGRRSRSGLVERFRPGAFVLAAALDAPVVPVAISGSRQGIRPDGMWIHPTILHCRVLPPMARLDGESHRQFAERCRTRISAARLAVLCEQLAARRMAANRLQHYTGLGGRIAAAVRAEHRAGAWRVLAAAVSDAPGPWLLLGCGWSTLAVGLRQLLPGAALIAVDADAQHRAAACCAWFSPGTDQLCAQAAAVVLPPRLAGMVCLPGADADAVAALAGRALQLLDGVLVVPRAEAEVWRARAPRPAPASAPASAPPNAPASAPGVPLGGQDAGPLLALAWPGG